MQSYDIGFCCVCLKNNIPENKNPWFGGIVADNITTQSSPNLDAFTQKIILGISNAAGYIKL